MKQAKALNDLTKKCNSDVARQYSVTEEQLRAISVEGLEKNWPMP